MKRSQVKPVVQRSTNKYALQINVRNIISPNPHFQSLLHLGVRVWDKKKKTKCTFSRYKMKKNQWKPKNLKLNRKTLIHLVVNKKQWWLKQSKTSIDKAKYQVASSEREAPFNVDDILDFRKKFKPASFPTVTLHSILSCWSGRSLQYICGQKLLNW